MKIYVISSKMSVHGVYTDEDKAKEICQALKIKVGYLMDIIENIKLLN